MSRFATIASLIVIISLLVHNTFAHSTQNSNEKLDEKLKKRGENLYEKAMVLLNKNQNSKKAYTLLQQSAQLNHLRATEMVAKAHLFGDHLPLDLSQSRQYLQSIPANQSSNAHLFLGFLNSKAGCSKLWTELGFKGNTEEMMRHYQLAALLGNPLAKMATAYRLYNGFGVKPNCRKALRLYHSVATDVVQESTTAGGSPLSDRHLWESDMIAVGSARFPGKHIVNYYRFLARNGDVYAMVTLGQLYYYGGRGVTRDRDIAFAYFKSAAESENGNALAFLAKCYLEGSRSVPRDSSKAMELLLMALRTDNPIAHTELGHIYMEGKVVEQNLSIAFTHFGRASYLGYVEGIVQIALFNMHGIGRAKDYRRAFQFFSLAEKSKHLLALYNLGQLHASGLGTVKSCPAAVSHFKSVAERGVWSQGLADAEADYEKFLWPTKEKVRQAITKFAFMSELGYESAQSNIAYILETIYKDMPSALQYWTRSAEQGLSYSRIKAGDFHYFGWGTPVDYSRTALYYRKASKTRYSGRALFNLGYMYEKGLGLIRDLKLARVYYQFAAGVDDDAKVPSMLAIGKLSCVEKLDNLFDFDSKDYLRRNWDLALGSVLAVILFVAIYLKVRSV